MLARYPIHTGLPTFPSVPSPHIERPYTHSKNIPKKVRPRKSTFRTRGHGDAVTSPASAADADVARGRANDPPRVRANRRCRYLTTVCARFHRLDRRASHVARGLDRARTVSPRPREESSRARVPPRGKTTRTSRSSARRRRSSVRSVEGIFNRRFRAVALGRRATTRARDETRASRRGRERIRTEVGPFCLTSHVS